MIYSIYHIPGIKIGCSDNPKRRVKAQGYIDYDVLETHTDIDIAAEREFELQKEYGYKVDDCKYNQTNYSEMGKTGGATNVKTGQALKMQKIGCSLGGKIGGKINGDKSALLGTGIHTFEMRSKGGKIGGKIAGSIVSNKIHHCEHCNTDIKGRIYFRWHGDNCKHA
jgi:hypothetical protein